MLDAGREPGLSVKVQCRNDQGIYLSIKEKKFKAYIINMRELQQLLNINNISILGLFFGRICWPIGLLNLLLEWT